jgi:hypothetical protein
MKNTWFGKGLAIGLLILFVGASAGIGTGQNKLSTVDPDLSFVTLTATEYPGLTTTPTGLIKTTSEIYEYVKVTVKNALGLPLPGMPSSAFVFTVTPTNNDTHWYGTLTLIFTPVDNFTNANGEIRFTVQSASSIQGYITIKVTVQGIPLNDQDDLLCNAYDTWKNPGAPMNGDVDGLDLGFFTSFWSVYGTDGWKCDYNWNGDVEGLDLGMFTAHWSD